ncbi:MAG: transglycosylase SLT domain-containing protein [Deltaproteobacteria bacterium]|nr:transglycosylase SLT domain-containing protein [Deltaproteobacteria bacterium]MBW2536309.1 transglycosylase SLT domain-containing protein [Deltaproteobacteria bacterium]
MRPGFESELPLTEGGVHEAELLRQLAARLGVEIRWIEVPRHDQLLRWLDQGRGDVAVGRFSPEGLAGTGASATSAVHWVVDLLVTGASDTSAAPADERPRQVHVVRSMLSRPLAEQLATRGFVVEPVPEEVSLEELLRRVSHGRYAYSVADSGLLELKPGLEVVVPLSPRRPLVWATREANGSLRRAIDDFLFAEQVLGRSSRTTACRDLAQVRKARVLRLVTKNSPATCTVERGGLDGFEYHLAHAFARDLGVRLELEIPPPGVEGVDWLEQGYGDLLALHEPAGADDHGRFRISVPYREVDLISVLASNTPMPAAVEDLAGIPVAASRALASQVRQLPLSPMIDAASPAPGFDSLAALREVSRGRIGVAVVDRDTARLELVHLADLRLGPVVLPEQPLVWLFNPSSPKLADRADRFLAAARVSGTVRQLAAAQLGSWSPPVPVSLPAVPDGAITPYDELLRWEGRRRGIDWRLLASIMYEESRFDPEAVGPGGSAGLFQFMPLTWQDLGFEDPYHPGEAVAAAGWYLDWLMGQFADMALPDQVAMAIASYNVGPRHVFDARRLARNMGFDQDRWEGSVETAMLLLDDPEVARDFPAGVCRCRRAVGYTRRILRRYRAYTEQFPPQ